MWTNVKIFTKRKMFVRINGDKRGLTGRLSLVDTSGCVAKKIELLNLSLFSLHYFTLPPVILFDQFEGETRLTFSGKQVAMP